MIAFNRTDLNVYENKELSLTIKIENRGSEQLQICSNVLEWDDNNVICHKSILPEIEVGLYVKFLFFINRKRTTEEQQEAFKEIMLFKKEKKINEETYKESLYLFCPSINTTEMTLQTSKEDAINIYYDTTEDSYLKSNYPYTIKNLVLWVYDGEDLRWSDIRAFVFAVYSDTRNTIQYDVIISDIRNYTQLGAEDIVKTGMPTLMEAVEKIVNYLASLNKKAIKLSDAEYVITDNDDDKKKVAIKMGNKDIVVLPNKNIKQVYKQFHL